MSDEGRAKHDEHMEEMHQKKVEEESNENKCDICNITFSSPAAISLHFDLKHKFPCPKCNLRFDNTEDLNTHMNDEVCAQCGGKKVKSRKKRKSLNVNFVKKSSPLK